MAKKEFNRKMQYIYSSKEEREKVELRNNDTMKLRNSGLRLDDIIQSYEKSGVKYNPAKIWEKENW